MAFNKLDFPDPLVPRTTVKVPRSSSRSTWSRARTSLAVPRWKACETASRRSAASGMLRTLAEGPATASWHEPREDQHGKHEEGGHQLESVLVEPGPDRCSHEQAKYH